MKKLVAIQLLLCCALSAAAEIKLPRLIRDSMILQRDQEIKLWGWADAQEKVTIRFNSKVYRTKASSDGRWTVLLPPTKAGGPYTMDISGSNRITLHEILFGDVWFCSGQSNMVHQLNIHDVTYAKDIAEANDPQIRQFWIPTQTSLAGPRTDLPGGYWKSAVGDDVRPFSAVAWFFAKKIHEKYGVPIGIINASVGGTPIEAWISEEGLKDFPALAATIARNKDTVYPQPAAQPPPPADAGLTAHPSWRDPAYVPKGWRNINIPGYWEDQGIRDLNGVVWYRREVDIPPSMAGKAARVFLGRIVDADELYINGKQVGSTGYQYPQRRYKVPEGLLKAGKNLFVVRVTNTNGKGGFVPDKPYCIFAGTDTVDLKGYWQYKVGSVFTPSAPSGAVSAQNQPAALYNAMVAGGIGYAIKGFCWYQGESNTGRPQAYAKLLPALINDWRSKWGAENLPFLYVQLPGFMDYNYTPSESNWAMLRESQLKALSVPHTAMTVAIDLGEWNDIHPDNKKDVGERLALAAMKVAYKENIVHSGPIYKSSAINGNRIIIQFDHTGSGLITADDEMPSSFAIAGADKKFVWADAKMEGDQVIVWSDAVPAPKYVRYAWADNPVNPNLFNREGLPASPFRTDE
ncbi:sialate O-acetylesterase [Chitinophaga cymbidii]|uniref:9-O-acetylesterase n=1 Tax=Chitinophaga cymbidii TaxID=1096750 RepID=A0A512RT65_9BACT|nr:sialate O-acetylesterase [Chitinophaga cymbidii]GEP98891.1 9-O-acetylesterase [Chitinophaga cymbidii]